MIDADIRNSVMSGVFSSQRKVSGLTDYLPGQAALHEVINDTDLENLDVILSGQYHLIRRGFCKASSLMRFD